MKLQYYLRPDNPRFMAALFLLIMITFLLLLSTGCNSEKVAMRKDLRAVDRVKGSRNLINQIAPIVNDLFPCNRDTVIKIKSDTIIHYDTTQNFYPYTDTVNKVDTLVFRITKTRTIHDTIKIVTDSKQRSMIDRQTIANLNTALSAANQSVIDAEKATKKADKWLWWFIGACVLFIGSNGIWIYSKIKV